MGNNEVTLTGTCYGSVHQMVLHFDKADQVTADLPALLVSVRDKFLDAIRQFSGSSFHWIQARGERLQSGGGGQVELLSFDLQGTGHSSTNSSLADCFVMQKRTGLAGRHNRGRFFLPNVDPGAHVNGLFTSGHMTLGNTKAGIIMGFYGPAGTEPYRLVIRQRFPSGDQFIGVTALIPRVTPGTQRRRNIGVGI